MSAEKIIGEWKKKVYKPVYWLEGEESFFIDKVMDFAEHHLLPESEASFNLTVFYGKDANWADVVNACCRYPMFAERQVVLLKEGQQMRDIEKLESYIEKPLSSTIFVISYKEKKVDGRSKLAKWWRIGCTPLRLVLIKRPHEENPNVFEMEGRLASHNVFGKLAELWNTDDQRGLSIPLLKRRPSQRHL